MCNSKINNILPLNTVNKEIDILFYGNILNDFSYRNSIIDKLKKQYDNTPYKFVVIDELYDETYKNDLLSRTKIVLHIPSHKKLYTFPWAKTAELSAKKVFYLIEENEEMYLQNLNSIVAFYKQSDINDLIKQINYYLVNDKERTIVVDKCYTHISMKYDTDSFITNLVKDISK
jgi:hypothetical protein